jgi:hypothetical protein
LYISANITKRDRRQPSNYASGLTRDKINILSHGSQQHISCDFDLKPQTARIKRSDFAEAKSLFIDFVSHQQDIFYTKKNSDNSDIVIKFPKPLIPSM